MFLALAAAHFALGMLDETSSGQASNAVWPFWMGYLIGVLIGAFAAAFPFSRRDGSTELHEGRGLPHRVVAVIVPGAVFVAAVVLSATLVVQAVIVSIGIGFFFGIGLSALVKSLRKTR